MSRLVGCILVSTFVEPAGHELANIRANRFQVICTVKRTLGAQSVLAHATGTDFAVTFVLREQILKSGK
jgi:hypothetical protein